MFTFNMSVSQNFASFIDKETGLAVFVDSFDNREFEVRFGTVEKSQPIGAIIAESDESLNSQLQKLVSKAKLH